MPILVVCSNCSTNLRVPDAAAGKKTKCPKCQTVCEVPTPSKPAFELVEEEPLEIEETPSKATVAAPQPKPIDAKADRPRKRKGEREEKEKSRGLSKLLIGLIIAGTLLVSCGGITAYWLLSRTKAVVAKIGDAQRAAAGTNTPAATKDTANWKWETYSSNDNVFKVLFPGKPEKWDWLNREKEVAVLPVSAKLTSDIRRFSTDEKSLDNSGLYFFAGYVRFPENARPDEWREVTDWLTTNADSYARSLQMQTDDATRGWKRIRVRASAERNVLVGEVRWQRVGSILHILGYRDRFAGSPPSCRDEFFKSYEILGGDPGDPDPVKLDGWQTYTSPNKVFKASFPGESQEKEINFFQKTEASEVRECVIVDEETKTTRTYFAGYIRFTKQGAVRQVESVRDFVKGVVFEGSPPSRTGSLIIGGRPGGVEWRKNSHSTHNGVTTDHGAIVRWLEIGSTVYILGMKNSDRMPTEKEIEKFFGSFEIIEPASKPGDKSSPVEKSPAAPPGWILYRQPFEGFRVFIPGDKRSVPGANLKLTDDQKKTMTAARSHFIVDGNIAYRIIVVQFVTDVTDEERQAAMNSIIAPPNRPAGRAKFDAQNKITWAGRDALENTYTPADLRMVRQTHNATIGFIGEVRAETETGKLDPDKARIFLDSFVIDKK